MNNDQLYYAHRAAAEWLAVAKAACDEARIVHAELARRYVELAHRPSNVFAIRRKTRPAAPPRQRRHAGEGGSSGS